MLSVSTLSFGGRFFSSRQRELPLFSPAAQSVASRLVSLKSSKKLVLHASKSVEASCGPIHPYFTALGFEWNIPDRTLSYRGINLKIARGQQTNLLAYMLMVQPGFVWHQADLRTYAEISQALSLKDSSYKNLSRGLFQKLNLRLSKSGLPLYFQIRSGVGFYTLCTSSIYLNDGFAGLSCANEHAVIDAQELKLNMRSYALGYKDNEPVPLEPKVASCLAFFLQKLQGQIQSSELIASAVWPEGKIQSPNVFQIISKVNKALLESQSGFEVVNVRGQGYFWRSGDNNDFTEIT
jgi:hypothetical protein